MPRPVMSRRSFNCTALASAIAALLPQSAASDDRSLRGTVLEESTRREVIKQRVPGEPQRQLTLVEVVYGPGAAMASWRSLLPVPSPLRLPVSPSGWERPGVVHRVSRHASSSEPARLLAIYIAPADATAEDLMKPI